MRERERSAIREAQQKGQQSDDFLGFNPKVQDYGRRQTSSHQTDLMSKGIWQERELGVRKNLGEYG